MHKFLDLHREQKNQWNIKVSVISIVVGAFGTAPSVFEKKKKLEKWEIRDKIETIQTATLLRSARILTRIMKIIRRPIVSQTPVNDPQLKLMWNTLKEWISALGTVTKGLIKRLEGLEIRGRAKTIQATALLRSARKLRRALEIWGDLLSLRPQ